MHNTPLSAMVRCCLQCVLLGAVLVQQATARMVPLSDNIERFPYLFDEGSARYIEWDSSAVTQSIAMSSAVRFTARGLYFLHRTELVVDAFIRGDSWKCVPCTMETNAFCRLDNGDGRLFPAVGTSVTIQDATGDAANNTLVFGKCVTGVGRSIQHGSDGATPYELSLCDLVDVGVTAVYRDGEVCLSQREPRPVYYIISSFLIVLLSIFATQNIIADLRLQGSDQLQSSHRLFMRIPVVWLSQLGVVALWVGLLVLTCIAAGPPAITVQDEVLHVANVVYVALYSVHWLLEIMMHIYGGGAQNCFPVNAILATVLFALSNFYGSYANNYIEIFLFLLLLRFVQKCMRKCVHDYASGSSKLMRELRGLPGSIIMVADVFYLSLLSCTAFRFHLVDDTYCEMYLAVLLVTAISIASVLQRAASK
jgi:hypothetical protein